MDCKEQLQSRTIVGNRPASAAVGKSVWSPATDGSKKGFEWLEHKFTGCSQRAALVDARENPDDAKQIETLGHQIRLALKGETFRNELLALLPEETRNYIEQNATINGEGNKLAQTSGQGNNVNIS